MKNSFLIVVLLLFFSCSGTRSVQKQKQSEKLSEKVEQTTENKFETEATTDQKSEEKKEVEQSTETEKKVEETTKSETEKQTEKTLKRPAGVTIRRAMPPALLIQVSACWSTAFAPSHYWSGSIFHTRSLATLKPSHSVQEERT